MSLMLALVDASPSLTSHTHGRALSVVHVVTLPFMSHLHAGMHAGCASVGADYTRPLSAQSDCTVTAQGAARPTRGYRQWEAAAARPMVI